MHMFRLQLNLQLFAQEKTEKATEKKRLDSRKKGQVAKSAELPAAFIMLFGFLALMMFGSYFKVKVFNLFSASFYDYILWEVSKDNVIVIFGQLLFQGFLFLAPIMLVSVIIAILGNYLQIGFLLTGEPFKLKLNKLNPIEGAKRIFSMRALVDFSKSMVKLFIVGLAVYTSLWSERENFLLLSNVPIQSTLTYTAKITVQLGVKIGIILVILALFDYMYQKYEYEKKLRMSKQDIKDEHKKSEGDPLIKSKIREQQRKMAFARMMQDVPKADVIITNPTHYAIAIRYDSERMEAPLVIAKGADYVALKIKEVAESHGITTMENKLLARTLYELVDIGEAIPADLFQAVAEVLAYVYKLKEKVT